MCQASFGVFLLILALKVGEGKIFGKEYLKSYLGPSCSFFSVPS